MFSVPHPLQQGNAKVCIGQGFKFNWGMGEWDGGMGQWGIGEGGMGLWNRGVGNFVRGASPSKKLI